MKGVLLAALTLAAGAGATDVFAATKDTERQPAFCKSAVAWMWEGSKGPGYHTSLFKGLTLEQGAVKAEFCQPGVFMSRERLDGKFPDKRSYTVTEEELIQRSGEPQNFSDDQRREFEKAVEALNKLPKENDRRVCAVLSKDDDVTYFKGLRMVENTPQAEFCTTATALKWKWKGFTMPVTFFLSDEQIKDRLADERLSQEQVKQFGMARAELRKTMQPK